MKDQEENLDLLDLEEDTETDTLPEAEPFSAPRPKRPWLLMGVGVAIIVLATWIIVTQVGKDSGTSVNVNLDAPVVEDLNVPVAAPDLNAPVKKAEIAPKQEKVVKPIETVKVVEADGNPVRVIDDRKEVTFNPDKATTKNTVKPVAAKKITAPTTQKSVKKPVVTATTGSIYVQFGSYSTRALAQAAEQKLRATHQTLFNGKQFVILAAEVNGKTIYRLRVPFVSASEANGFCRNAKSDGLDCYVAK